MNKVFWLLNILIIFLRYNYMNLQIHYLQLEMSTLCTFQFATQVREQMERVQPHWNNKEVYGIFLGCLKLKISAAESCKIHDSHTVYSGNISCYFCYKKSWLSQMRNRLWDAISPCYIYTTVPAILKFFLEKCWVCFIFTKIIITCLVRKTKEMEPKYL